MQQAVASQSPKVLILLGAGLTGSIVLKNGRLSELIAQLQDLLKDVDKVEFLPYKYDHSLLAAQIRQLAQEIKELSMSNPVTILNRNSDSSGIFSYLVPAAALGAMGYCYMWWKGWSFSDVMFVTKRNMADAVATVSKQLEHVSQTLTVTKKHLTKRLETLDWKLEDQMETSQLIANNVNEMNLNLSQIGLDVDMIYQMVAGVEGKIDRLESKSDVTNANIRYLCQVAADNADQLNAKLIQDAAAKLAIDSAVKFEEKSPKGLLYLAETNELVSDKQMTSSDDRDLDVPMKKAPVMKTTVHRSYTVGISWAQDIMHS
ncbi:hypothetical protein SLA2020_049890 [Shorea laevis]